MLHPHQSPKLLRREFESTTMPFLNELFGTAVRLTRNERDAEDLVQETYLKAFKCFDQFERGTNCRAWMYKILTNTFINGYRRSKKERGILERQIDGREEHTTICPDSADRFSNPERTLVQHALSDDVKHALDAVPADFRTAVVLCDLEGLSYKEIADAMGTPIGTVMSRLFRGRRLLRQSLEGFAREHGYSALSDAEPTLARAA